MVAIVRDGGAETIGTNPGEPQKRVRQFSDWTPANTGRHTEKVLVYSNCESVELFLNGVSLGATALPADGSPRTWTMDYQPGVLKAVARNQGKVVAGYELRSAGKPVKILLSVDRKKVGSSWDDLAFVTATVVDANGVVVPTARDLVKFKLGGKGTIVAVENNDMDGHDLFQTTETHSFRGRCVALVRGKGDGGIAVSATGVGLEGGVVRFEGGEGGN